MSSNNKPPSDFPSGSQFLPDGRIQCRHGQVLHRKTCRSGNNAGKMFYSCIKDRTDPLNCRFFMWNEEVEAVATNMAPGSSSPRWMPLAELPEEAPVLTPRKRQRAQTPLTPTHSPEYPTGDQEFSSLKRARVQDNESTTLGSAYKLTRQNMPLHDAEENPFLLSNVSSAPSSGHSPSKLLSEERELNDALQIFTTIVEDYKKVKRQKVAAEKARDAKAERTAQLEKQIVQLKELNESLQKQIEIYRGMLGQV